MSETKDFVIKDKRFFAEENRDQDKKEPSTEEVEEHVSKEDASDEDPAAEFQLPEINFATFIMSLNASALMNLGVIDDPNTGKKVKNLPIGKQTIDILAMLEEKTRGNLTQDEENMLKNILYDLRMIYVKEKQ
jgi:hypothetical protein